MNRRALIIGLVYSAVAIAFKLIILLGGYTLSKFGFYYSHIISVLAILPFFFLAVYLVREKEQGGIIGGKECVRICLTVLAVAVIVTSIYTYIEFEWRYREISVSYYHGQEYLNLLKEQAVKYPDKLKPEQFPKIIDDQIAYLSPFRAATGKLFTLIIIGLSGTFVVGVFMKKSKSRI